MNLQVICAEDCGNAPRKQLLLDLNVALVTGATAGAGLLRDDVVWEIVGEGCLTGRDAAAAAWLELAGTAPRELHVHHIITHGSTAALNATLTRANGTRVAYCDVYIFAGAARNAPIKTVTSYRVLLG